MLKFLRPLFILVAINGVAQFSYAEQAPKKIKIGALLCLTTSCSDYGTNSLNGILLALEEEKTKGEFDIELVVEDSMDSTPKNTVSAYQSIVRKLGSGLIIGTSWSAGGLAIAPIIAKNPNILVISPSIGLREFNETSDNIFNVWSHDDVATSILAEKTYSDGFKNVAIVVTMEPWEQTQAKTFQKKFESLGGKITSFIEYQSSESDLKTHALKTVKSKPDAVLLANYTHMGLFAKELKKNGYKGKKLAILMDKNQTDISHGALEGVEFTINSEANASFKNTFTKRFGNVPGISADTAYDAFKLLIKAIKETNSTDPLLISKSLLATKGYQGVSGEISFDEKGGIVRKPTIVKLVGDKYEIVVSAL